MIIRIALMGVLMATVGILLREMGWRHARAYSVVAAVILLSGIGDTLAELVSGLEIISGIDGVSDVALSALKVIGVGYVFGISESVAEELGERGVARAVSLAARLEMLLIALPYIRDILSLGLELIE